jgi:hypothetical protein
MDTVSQEVQQQRAVRAADVLDRLGASLVELNGRLRVADEDPAGRRAVLEAFNEFVETTLPQLTDLSMQIRPARIVRPGE